MRTNSRPARIDPKILFLLAAHRWSGDYGYLFRLRTYVASRTYSLSRSPLPAPYQRNADRQHSRGTGGPGNGGLVVLGGRPEVAGSTAARYGLGHGGNSLVSGT